MQMKLVKLSENVFMHLKVRDSICAMLAKINRSEWLKQI